MIVTFSSGPLTLEGALTLTPASARAAVICHPHPQYGGDMDNPVVCAIEAALQQSGFATLRFNFRGTGASTGSYANGLGEADDARAAVAYLAERSGVPKVTLAGYSFGAMVALQAGARLTTVDRLIAVATPLSFLDLGFLAECSKPKLFLVGDCDQYCTVAVLREQLASVAAPKTERVLAGADHFFFGHAPEITEAVSAFVGAVI